MTYFANFADPLVCGASESARRGLGGVAWIASPDGRVMACRGWDRQRWRLEADVQVDDLVAAVHDGLMTWHGDDLEVLVPCATTAPRRASRTVIKAPRRAPNHEGSP